MTSRRALDNFERETKLGVHTSSRNSKIEGVVTDTVVESKAGLKTPAYAAKSAKSPLGPFSIERRTPRPHDVLIDILYCGVCHSDVHQVRDEWGGSIFPMVPGHEIIGKVVDVGTHVSKWKKGNLVGVGCFVDSDRTCPACVAGEEQFCEGGMTLTYNGYERDGKTPTYGGYSTRITVDENYVLRIPKGIPLERAAPLLCAGITTYSALKLGADDFIATKDEDAFIENAGRFDFILDTVSAKHDYNSYLNLLHYDGIMVLVGVPEPGLLSAPSLILKRRTLAGSLIGGIRETQEMLDFCAEHGIAADVEMIAIDEINEAYERMLENDVRYRFVIDIASLK